VGVACLESFFINLRLLTEFLNSTSSRAKRDLITRHDFLPGWDLPDGARKDSISQTHKFISDQVGHLNRARVPENASGIIDVTPMALRTQALNVYEAMQLFVDALTAAASEHAETFAGYLADARSRQHWE